MLRGFWNGETLGSGTDHWKYYTEFRAGKVSAETVDEVLAGTARSGGDLYDHGDGGHDDVSGRDAGNDIAGCIVNSCTGFPIMPLWPPPVVDGSLRWSGRISRRPTL